MTAECGIIRIYTSAQPQDSMPINEFTSATSASGISGTNEK